MLEYIVGKSQNVLIFHCGYKPDKGFKQTNGIIVVDHEDGMGHILEFNNFLYSNRFIKDIVLVAM